MGNAFESDKVNFGPLINKRQFDAVNNFIASGINDEKL